MEKDIHRIKKNDETEIIIRIDNFGGQPGLTIREFVTSQSYTGFTKAGVRIKEEKFQEFKTAINSIGPKDLSAPEPTKQQDDKKYSEEQKQKIENDESGISKEGFM